jgi:putative FmdB family regulatory protein
MPTYEYICRACGHEFEEFQSIKADPIAVCPKCRKKKVERKIGIGGAVIFKGGGFYETDYRSESYRSGEEAEKKSAETKIDSKADAKTDAKTDGAAGATKDAKADGKAAPKTDANTAAETGAKTDASSGTKPDAKPAPKPESAAAAAENKRIEARATHQSRIGRGIGNIVRGAAKASKGAKPAKPASRGRKK